MHTLVPRVLPLAVVALLAAPLAAQTVDDKTPIPPPNPQKSSPNSTKGWPGYARNAQHGALATARVQSLNSIHWSVAVDQNPQYSGSNLLIHYGSPMATKHDTIVFPVKTGAFGNFQVQGRTCTTGTLKWTATTDWTWAPHNWSPSMGCTLTPDNKVAIPGSGGTILVRTDADQNSGTLTRMCFYGMTEYTAHKTTYDSNVYVSTPITSDDNGNLYFGYLVAASVPNGMLSGIARVAPDGTGTRITAFAATLDASIRKVTYNCAPALSRDGASVYVTVNDQSGSGFGLGYLVRLNSTTLSPQSKVRLKDPSSGSDAFLPDDGTSSPTIGPDGDVYIGVLENPFPNNNDRGWLLHYNSGLTTTKIAGAFGWDDTGSLVPAGAVPSYAGSSSYLMLTKYNNYAGYGDGVNKLAVLDPFVQMTDPITGAHVMKEVITVKGVTPDTGFIGTYPNAVREWCINTAAIDPLGHSALVNSEDGKLYRWDFVSNTLNDSIVLTAGIGEAYTPTVVAADGTVFAISNAILFAIGD